MPRRQKFKHVMSVIERRIRQGDYLLNPIPGERKIVRVCRRGEYHDRLRPSGLDHPSRRYSVGSRHPDVHQDQVRLDLSSQLDRTLGRICLADRLEAVGRVHELAHHSEKLRLVVHGQDASATALGPSGAFEAMRQRCLVGQTPSSTTIRSTSAA